jgi:hypothetical protein
MAASPSMTLLTSPPPRHRPACGHYVGDRARPILFRVASSLPGEAARTLTLHSIASGDHALAWEECPHCQRSADYVYRDARHSQPITVGQDVSLVRSALLAMLNQPDVAVFTLVAREPRERAPLTTFVVPRHQLPILELEHDRAR